MPPRVDVRDAGSTELATSRLSSGDRKRLRSRFVRLLQRLPITAIVVAPYLILVLPMAIINSNPKSGFIAGLVVVAAASALVIELILLPLRARKSWELDIYSANSSHTRLGTIARTTALVSIVADSVSAAYGGGTIFQQVSGQVSSSLAVRLGGLVFGWKYIAVGLLLASFLGGRMSRRSVQRWIAAIALGQIFVTSLTARTAPVFAFITFVAIVGLLFGLFQVRYVAIAIAITFLLWPTIFTIRNGIRASGGVTVSTTVTAGDRLRFDLQVSRAGELRVPVKIETPTVLDAIRYGAIPRILDPGRPVLSTGSQINVYLGGDTTSSFTFLPLGTIYFLGGYQAILVFYAGWALAAGLLLLPGGAPGPIRISVFCLVLSGPLGWTSTYPDSMVGFVQYVVAALPIFLVIANTRQRCGNLPRLEIRGSAYSSLEKARVRQRATAAASRAPDSHDRETSRSSRSEERAMDSISDRRPES